MLPAAGSGTKDHASSPQTPVSIDRYQIGGIIGRGGMAEVYRGKLKGLGGFERDVAVKVLLPQLSVEPEFVNMLLDEARIAGTINHGNVVQVLDVGQDGQVFYLVMEYVDGIDLRSVEKRHERGQVPTEPLLYIIAEVLRGLEAIHTARDGAGQLRRIVHRDVTPSNVLLTSSGAVKLADFGIAHATGRLTQTRHGAVKGKTRYMAPEQLDGKPIDQRTDLFAVGVVLLEALLGRDAADVWHSTAMGPIFKIPLRVPPSVPRDIAPILARALAGAVEARYQSAGEFRRDVLRALQARTQERGDALAYGADQLEGFLQPLLDRGDGHTNPGLRRPGASGRAEEASDPSRPSMALAPSGTMPVPPAPAMPPPEPSGTLPVGPRPLPRLSTEPDPSTETAASMAPAPATLTVPLAAVPTQATVTLPVVSGAIDLTPPPLTGISDSTLPVGPPPLGGLALLADDVDSSQAATAVTAALRVPGLPGTTPLSEQKTVPPHPSPYVSAYQPVPQLRPSLRSTLANARVSLLKISENTFVRTLRDTVMRPGGRRLSLKLLGMVLAGLLLGIIGLIVLFQVQAQRRAVVAVPVPRPAPPPPPVEAPPPPATGQLQILSPPGTRVLIDGVMQPEPAPGTYELPPGPHKLRLQVPRRRELSRSVEIQAGRQEQLKL